ncbi:polysaccharide lyase 6 family protein [Aquimarina sp. 2201CG14-23]|uniref:polysaccharide lyase 6 family protein n=1 Tax=Aquimarina mycalae TaxID=3040073 RepID=UPI002477E53E|nr:polysaccharide lyase 6 family protein [Aquimarina sp. 2201CG14-23]MDH7448076.1 polysaccharide lyase 6 family protein [Aquimarina sp. 2201CG14-23]
MHLTKQHIITATVSFLLFFMGCVCFANEVKVATIDEFNSAIKSAKAGDRIILKNGEWKDVKLIAKGQGTSDHPIIIEAEESGKVFITGDSSLKIAGTHLIIKGLWFKNGFTSDKSVISFRVNSKEFATHSRLTDCAITYYNPNSKAIGYKWISIWGKNNRVDHNYFAGKTNSGTTLVVWLKGEEHIQNNHRIDHNYFGERPALGFNGGETIRIGTSKNSLLSSRTIVEDNVFEKCNGEVEIISNKSCDNVYRNNLFLESQGVLTLRHGNRCLIENNVFIGNQKPHTGGIRIINAGHVVRNNLMMNLTGDGFRGPIVVMNGVPNSPANRYHQVKDVHILNNTIINSSPIQFCAGKDEERSLAPANTIFANNLIFNDKGDDIAAVYDTLDGIKFYGNILDTGKEFNKAGFTKVKVNWDTLENILYIPNAINEELIKNSKSEGKLPKLDITGTKRTTFVAGAYNLGNTKLPKALILKSGTSWDSKVVPPKPIVTSEIIEVEPGVGTLRKALKKASNGSIIQLKSGEYILEKGIKIRSSITIQGNSKSKKALLKVKDGLEKNPTYFFRVEGGNTLRLNNLEISGNLSTPIKYAVVSPDKGISEPYSVFIDNCYIHSFKNKNGGSIYKAYKGTFADTVSIVNSRIENAYRGINLSEEKDNFGKYSAQVVNIDNTIFKDIEQWAVNYYRGGTDESTLGGKIIVDNSVFSNVGNTEKGTVLRTKGIVWVDIKNSVFEKSYRVINPVNLKGNKNTLSNCIIFDCGTVKATKGASAKDVLYKNPKWEDKENFIPSEKSPLRKQQHIGLKWDTKKQN